MHYAAYRGYDVSDKWKHDKLLKDKFGRTIAMHYANNGIIPP